MFADPPVDGFEARWRAAIAQTIRSCGARDRFGTDKTYFRSDLRAGIGQALLSRRRVRALILPKTQGRPTEEWPAPSLYFDRTALGRALPVLKILLAPGWVLQAHDVIPEQRVVHMVRPPQDFVQSWWSRYVTGIGGGPEKVFADNQPSVRRILRHFGREPEMPRHYRPEALVASELWRWRYVNEVMLERLSGTPRYIRLTYDSVIEDRLHWAETLYRFAGLDMSPDSRQAIDGLQNTLFGKRKSDGLDAQMVAHEVARVLDQSPWRSALEGSG